MKFRAFSLVASTAIGLAACSGSSMFGQQSTPPATQAAAAASPAVPQTAMSSDMIRDIQRSLGAKGYAVGAVDGVYGEGTQSALQHFQRDQNLRASGQIDSQTLAALGLTGQTTATAAPAPASNQSQYTPAMRRGGQTSMSEAAPARIASAGKQKVSPDMVRDIQQGLQDRGYKIGRVDGIWGRHTRLALLKFQKDQKLSATGRIDERTLAALNIGKGNQQTGQLPENQ